MGDSAEALARARHLFQEGLHDQAEEIVESILRERPDETTALDFRGYLHYRKGSLDAALAAYARLAELEPAVPGHHANLGLICFKAQRYAQARRAFERLLELQPGDVKAWRNLGFCQERLGALQEAADCFARGGDEEQLGRVRARLQDAGAGAAGTPGDAPRIAPEAAGGAATAPGRDAPAQRSVGGSEVEFSAWVGRAAVPARGLGPDLLRVGPGELVVRVRGKAFLNPLYCIGHRGVVVFARTSRDAEKAAGKFGEAGGLLARVEGNGELVLSGLGRGLQTFRLAGGRLFVNWGSLVLCGGEIGVTFEQAGAVKGAFLATALAGPGAVVLAVRGAPVVLPVAPELPVLVRPQAVVAWTEGLSQTEEVVPELRKMFDKQEALRYRFEGRGHLVLQSC